MLERAGGVFWFGLAGVGEWMGWWGNGGGTVGERGGLK